MNNWNNGNPKEAIDIAVVLYMDDWEFARFDGETWQIYQLDIDISHDWIDAQEEIQHWCELRRP